MIDPDRYQCLGELLQDALVQFKSETALIEAHRREERERISYLEFKRRSMPIAQRLTRANIGAGDRVAIIMGNQSRWLLGAYAALYRGAIIVPLDYKLTADEQLALLNHAKPQCLLVESAMFDRFRGKEVGVPLVIVSEAPAKAALGAAERWEDCLANHGDVVPDLVLRGRDDVASIVYSSGTGGRPKGCMLTHDNYLEQYKTLSRAFPMGVGSRYFSILPTNHAIDFMCGFIGPLAGGATIVHQRTLRPEFILQTMRNYRITHMAIVPLILEAFERSLREKLDSQSSAVRTLLDAVAGLNESLTRKQPNKALSRLLLKPVHDAFGGDLELLFCGGAFVDRQRADFFYRLGIPVVIGYGLTEACTVATVNDLRPFRADSVGPPVTGTEIRILNPDEEGVGEVLIGGRTIMTGYLDDEELTKETIRGGWLHTGDLGWMDASHHLHLVGRSKNMIVTAGGKNIYPEDVESTFDGVPCEELAVFASGFIWPGTKLEDEQLVAIVRPNREGNHASLLEELDRRNRSLPDFKRLGAALIWDEEFPRTASMKIKRQVLVDMLRATTGNASMTALASGRGLATSTGS